LAFLRSVIHVAKFRLRITDDAAGLDLLYQSTNQIELGLGTFDAKNLKYRKIPVNL
jgi:hypothetical protein